jgi:hypothetical protein
VTYECGARASWLLLLLLLLLGVVFPVLLLLLLLLLFLLLVLTFCIAWRGDFFLKCSYFSQDTSARCKEAEEQLQQLMKEHEFVSRHAAAAQEDARDSQLECSRLQAACGELTATTHKTFGDMTEVAHFPPDDSSFKCYQFGLMQCT